MGDYSDINELERLLARSLEMNGRGSTAPFHRRDLSFDNNEDDIPKFQRANPAIKTIIDQQTVRDSLIQTLKQRIAILEQNNEVSSRHARSLEDDLRKVTDRMRQLERENHELSSNICSSMNSSDGFKKELLVEKNRNSSLRSLNESLIEEINSLKLSNSNVKLSQRGNRNELYNTPTVSQTTSILLEDLASKDREIANLKTQVYILSKESERDKYIKPYQYVDHSASALIEAEREIEILKSKNVKLEDTVKLFESTCMDNERQIASLEKERNFLDILASEVVELVRSVGSLNQTVESKSDSDRNAIINSLKIDIKSKLQSDSKSHPNIDTLELLADHISFLGVAFAELFEQKYSLEHHISSNNKALDKASRVLVKLEAKLSKSKRQLSQVDNYLISISQDVSKFNYEEELMDITISDLESTAQPIVSPELNLSQESRENILRTLSILVSTSGDRKRIWKEKLAEAETALKSNEATIRALNQEVQSRQENRENAESLLSRLAIEHGKAISNIQEAHQSEISKLQSVLESERSDFKNREFEFTSENQLLKSSIHSLTNYIFYVHELVNELSVQNRLYCRFSKEWNRLTNKVRNISEQYQMSKCVSFYGLHKNPSLSSDELIVTTLNVSKPRPLPTMRVLAIAIIFSNRLRRLIPYNKRNGLSSGQSASRLSKSHIQHLSSEYRFENRLVIAKAKWITTNSSFQISSEIDNSLSWIVENIFDLISMIKKETRSKYSMLNLKPRFRLSPTEHYQNMDLKRGLWINCTDLRDLFGLESLSKIQSYQSSVIAQLNHSKDLLFSQRLDIESLNERVREKSTMLAEALERATELELKLKTFERKQISNSLSMTQLIKDTLLNSSRGTTRSSANDELSRSSTPSRRSQRSGLSPENRFDITNPSPITPSASYASYHTPMPADKTSKEWDIYMSELRKSNEVSSKLQDDNIKSFQSDGSGRKSVSFYTLDDKSYPTSDSKESISKWNQDISPLDSSTKHHLSDSAISSVNYRGSPDKSDDFARMFEEVNGYSQKR